MGNVFPTIKTATDEIQERNGQDHQRVYDPASEKLLVEILEQMKKQTLYLQTIVGEEL